MIKNLFLKYKDAIPYVIFGVLTTVINWISYKLCYETFKIENVPSTCIAWVLAVTFAFFTNKVWVFGSKSFDKKTLKKEFISFYSARLITGVLDVLIMWIAVDNLHRNSDLWKIISNVIIIVINYVASKFYIFSNKSR